MLRIEIWCKSLKSLGFMAPPVGCFPSPPLGGVTGTTFALIQGAARVSSRHHITC